MKTFHVITIHPQFIDAYSQFGVFASAKRQNIASIEAVNLRHFAKDKHGSVDGSPYGGGDGMVMRPDILGSAIASCPEKACIITTSPEGIPFDHQEAEALANESRDLVFVCGRFAGIDQRFYDCHVEKNFSLGNFVISGGELAVLSIIDATLRLIPGTLGNQASHTQDSFGDDFRGRIEHPQYTKPIEYMGQPVPEVLLSGNHAAIDTWREEESLKKTNAWKKRLALKREQSDT